nr:peptidoglycan-binding domain-containing protein [Azospirillum soli]
MVDAPEGPEQTRIQQIQTIVGVKADGVYGPATKAAVASWQSAHGLTADGVVGPKTTAAMELTA